MALSYNDIGDEAYIQYPRYEAMLHHMLPLTDLAPIIAWPAVTTRPSYLSFQLEQRGYYNTIDYSSLGGIGKVVVLDRSKVPRRVLTSIRERVI
jgi:hypothetical protein